MLQRTDTFRYNYYASLAQGLMCAGLGFRGSDKTTHFQDSSLYGNHGTLTNMAPAEDWVFDATLGRWTLDYDGADDYVSIANPGSVFDGMPISFAVWHYHVASGTQYPRLIDRVYNGQFSFYITEGGTYGAALKTAGGTQDTSAIPGASVVSGAWSHVAFVWNLGNLLIYRNGQHLATKSYHDGGLAASTSAVRIGQRVDGTNRQFEGRMADPMLYNRILSQAEIQQLADPSNVMLSGLILPPRRKLWPVATSGTYSTTIEMPVFQLTI